MRASDNCIRGTLLAIELHMGSLIVTGAFRLSSKPVDGRCKALPVRQFSSEVKLLPFRMTASRLQCVAIVEEGLDKPRERGIASAVGLCSPPKT